MLTHQRESGGPEVRARSVAAQSPAFAGSRPRNRPRDPDDAEAIRKEIFRSPPRRSTRVEVRRAPRDRPHERPADLGRNRCFPVSGTTARWHRSSQCRRDQWNDWRQQDEIGKRGASINVDKTRIQPREQKRADADTSEKRSRGSGDCCRHKRRDAQNERDQSRTPRNSWMPSGDRDFSLGPVEPIFPVGDADAIERAERGEKYRGYREADRGRMQRRQQGDQRAGRKKNANRQLFRRKRPPDEAERMVYHQINQREPAHDGADQECFQRRRTPDDISVKADDEQDRSDPNRAMAERKILAKRPRKIGSQ